LGVTTILILCGMSRHFRGQVGFDESDVPYGPNEAIDEPEDVSV
jgi:hypothetical protein